MQVLTTSSVKKRNSAEERGSAKERNSAKKCNLAKECNSAKERISTKEPNSAKEHSSVGVQLSIRAHLSKGARPKQSKMWRAEEERISAQCATSTDVRQNDAQMHLNASHQPFSSFVENSRVAPYPFTTYLDSPIVP